MLYRDKCIDALETLFSAANRDVFVLFSSPIRLSSEKEQKSSSFVGSANGWMKVRWCTENIIANTTMFWQISLTQMDSFRHEWCFRHCCSAENSETWALNCFFWGIFIATAVSSLSRYLTHVTYNSFPSIHSESRFAHLFRLWVDRRMSRW